MKYLDFHQHYGWLTYRGTKIDGGSDPDKTFEKIVIENCKKLDMVVAINGCGIVTKDNGRLGLINKNDEVEVFFKKYPDNIIGVGYIDLDYNQPDYIDNLYKRGFKAIKTTCPAERYDSQKYFEIYSRCQYWSMPILFHTGIIAAELFSGKKGACSFNMHPIFLEVIGADFPDLQIVGAHLGTGNYPAACTIADESYHANKNLKFDISAEDHYRHLIQEGKYIKKEIPVEMVIWGLDEPPTRYEELINEWNEYFDDINLTQEEKDMIFYKNSSKILNIK